MSLLALDDDGDLLISGNHWVIINGGQDEVIQRVRSRLHAYRGEWFLNLDVGVPYWTEVFVKGISTQRIRAAFIREIRTVPGVKELLSFDLSLNNASRTLTILFSVRSTTGDVIDFEETVGTTA